MLKPYCGDGLNALLDVYSTVVLEYKFKWNSVLRKSMLNSIYACKSVDEWVFNKTKSTGVEKGVVFC